jgi:hypothetical protein
MQLVVSRPRSGATENKVSNLPTSLCISSIHTAARHSEETAMEVVATVMLTSIVLYMIQQVKDL